MNKDFLYRGMIFGSLITFILLSKYIFKHDYWQYTNIIIICTFVVWIVLSIILIVTNRVILENIFEDAKGRGVGGIMLFCSMFFIFPYFENLSNKNITTVYSGDYEKIVEVKTNYKDYKAEVSLKLQEVELTKIYEKLEKEQSENITYYYDLPTSKESIDIIENTIKDAHIKVNDIFKSENSINGSIAIFYSFEKLGVKDIEAEGFVNLLNGIINFKSFHTYKTNTIPKLYEYEEYIKLTDETILNKYKSLIVHEYTHKLTNDLIDANKVERLDIPRWFYEGVAIYSEKMYSYEETTYEITEKVDLNNSSGFNTNNPKNYYETSGSVINYLVTNYGDTIVIDLVKDFKNTNDFNKSIENLTNKSLDELVIACTHK